MLKDVIKFVVDEVFEYGDLLLIVKLKKYKDVKKGIDSMMLFDMGIKVMWFQFKLYGVWMKVICFVKGDLQGVMNIYFFFLCKFDGEKLMIIEFKELVFIEDVFYLFGEVMGGMMFDEDSENDEGNVLY